MERRKKNYDARDHFLWPDLPDAPSRLAGRVRRTPRDRFERWMSDGYMILEGAVSDALIDQFLGDLSDVLSRPGHGIRMTYWDGPNHHYDDARSDRLNYGEAKILDLHARMTAAQKVIFAPTIEAALSDIFQDDVVAFQSLYFEYGSQQSAHQDTAFVYTRPAYHFVASWVALQDVTPGSGELFYYPGSQKLDDLIFSGGNKELRSGDPNGDMYSMELEKMATDAGLLKARFLPKKGDVLLWSADLIHGGEPILTQESRRSIVTHYCPRRAKIPYLLDDRHLFQKVMQSFRRAKTPSPQDERRLSRVKPRAWVTAQY